MSPTSDRIATDRYLAAEPDDTGRGDGRVDRPVVRRRRQLDDDLRVVQHGHHQGVRTGPDQRPVVGAAVAAEAYPGPVDGDRRYDDEPGAGHGVTAEPRTGRLAQATA